MTIEIPQSLFDYLSTCSASGITLLPRNEAAISAEVAGPFGNYVVKPVSDEKYTKTVTEQVKRYKDFQLYESHKGAPK